MHSQWKTIDLVLVHSWNISTNIFNRGKASSYYNTMILAMKFASSYTLEHNDLPLPVSPLLTLRTIWNIAREVSTFIKCLDSMKTTDPDIILKILLKNISQNTVKTVHISLKWRCFQSVNQFLRMWWTFIFDWNINLFVSLWNQETLRMYKKNILELFNRNNL